MFCYDRRLCQDEEAKRIIFESLRENSEASVSDILSYTCSAISTWNKTQHRNSQEEIEKKKKELNEALSSLLNDTVLIQDISAKLNAAYLAEENY